MRIRSKSLIGICFLVFASVADTATAEAAESKVSAPEIVSDDLALSIGRSALWPVSSRGTISVSNGSILRVSDQGQTLKVTALKLGAAVVRSGFRTLEVNVIPESSYRLYASLHGAIQGRRGLSISAADGSLKVVGRLLRADDWFAVADAVSGVDAGKFTFAATLEPTVESAARKEIAARLMTAGLAHVDLRFSPDVTATVGTEPKDAHSRAEKILAPFGIRVESNSSVLALEPLVRVKILVAEIKQSFRRQFGVQWPEVLSATLLPERLFPSGSVAIGIRAIEDNGWGRVLASPNLLCRSGKEAEFMAGGEIPIKLSSLRSSNVVWKNYGVMLRVKPLADLSGRMSIAIETEVSALDDSQKVDGVPGLLTNRMQTHFDLTRSRTIALSGLIKSDLSNHSSGLPGLGSIPILGSLFSSKDFRDDRSELIIFVTPEVMKPDDDDLEKNP
jgi:pilus assembly protein CpaC